MLIGEYTHSIADKKRLSLPAKFRKEIGKTIVVTKGLETCLFVFSKEEWKKVLARLSELSMGKASSRDFNRFLLAGAVEVDVDAIGRILIPDFLKIFAGLKNKVIFAGVGNRIEVWNEEAWQTYKKTVEREADKLAEKLGDIGMI
ncbi:MAG: division/cell wall cluster transcriptional repressor MraZ [Candidatus Lloydbacteria bacterium]|nr:division/cell wall cluster transcriptional repressor MraZ [Candidatus Lloydbacteria bacterium]